MNINYFVKDDIKTYKKIGVVISTFRSEVFDMYVAVLEKLDIEKNLNVLVITAREYFVNTEFGDFNFTENEKLKKWYFLKKRFKNCLFEIVEKNDADNAEISELGIKSSLVSQTRDEYATSEKYHDLYCNYYNLAKGSFAVAQALSCFELVYIFNGRVASVRAIADKFRQLNKQIRFFEWSASPDIPTPNDGFGMILSFSPHDGKHFCNLIENFFIENHPFELPNKISIGFGYIENKFTNMYVKDYDKENLDSYNGVYFLSSNDEFSCVDASYSFINKQIENITTISKINSGIKNIAVRGHPNSVNANPIFNELVKNRCIQSGFKYFDCYSKIDSYSLILNSAKVYVDNSSIGIEAVALGKKLFYFGDPYYAGLIGLPLNHSLETIEYPSPNQEIMGLIKLGFFNTKYYWVKPASFRRHKKYFIKLLAIRLFRLFAKPINFLIKW